MEQEKNQTQGKKFKIVTLFFSYSIVGIVFLIGVIMSITMLHEYSHLNDYKSINKTSDELCFLVYPNEMLKSQSSAYYSLSYPKEEIYKVSLIDEYSEIKARILTFLVICLIVLSYLVVLKDWSRNG